jgi:RHS repeat-associated protein
VELGYSAVASLGTLNIAGSDYVSTAFDLAGRPTSRTDQRGTVHTYTYDSAGRLEKDGVTAFGGDTDTYIQAIKFTYDTIGRRTGVASYTTSACTGTPANDVAWAYDGDAAGDLGWGGVKASYQDHAGTAGGGDPSVQYAYADGATGTAAKYVRLSSVTYPGPATPRTVYFNYSTTGVGGAVGQLSNIASDAQGTTKHVQYTYLGMQTILSVQTPGTYLSYGGFGRFPGFDRFGRVVWQKWGGDPGQDAYFYGYDRGSNRIWRAERRVRYQFQQSPDRGRDEGYAYDGLNRLVWAQRGTLTGTRTAGHPFAAYDGDFNLDGLVNTTDYNILLAWANKGGDEWSEGDVYPDGTVNVNDYLLWLRVYNSQQPTRSVTHEWTWGLEALGNWGSYNTSVSGSATLSQTRTHDAANELINISSTGGVNWVSPTYDAAGNMTSGPKPSDEANRIHLKFDAWNKLVKVSADNNGNPGDPIALYVRDGLGRRIAKVVATQTAGHWDRTDFYYNDSWQILEERRSLNQTDTSSVATSTYIQNLWDIRYIDAMACRWRDTNSDGTLDETLYYCNDANMNVTALVNTSGSVVERYQYTPYGSVTVCDSAWSPRAGNVSAYDNSILYCGYRFDWETGLYDVRNRMYHPTLGRWGQRDPLGYVDGMSLYEYVRGAPIRYGDWSGRGLMLDINTPLPTSRSDQCTCGGDVTQLLVEHINAFISQQYADTFAPHIYAQSDVLAGKGRTLIDFSRGNGLTLRKAIAKMADEGECPNGKACEGTMTLCGKCFSLTHFDHFLIIAYLAENYSPETARMSGQLHELEAENAGASQVPHLIGILGEGDFGKKPGFIPDGVNNNSVADLTVNELGMGVWQEAHNSKGRLSRESLCAVVAKANLEVTGMKVREGGGAGNYVENCAPCKKAVVLGVPLELPLKYRHPQPQVPPVVNPDPGARIYQYPAPMDFSWMFRS